MSNERRNQREAEAILLAAGRFKERQRVLGYLARGVKAAFMECDGDASEILDAVRAEIAEGRHLETAGSGAGWWDVA